MTTLYDRIEGSLSPLRRGSVPVVPVLDQVSDSASHDYVYQRMLFWYEEAERLRARYNQGKQEALAQGKEVFYWQGTKLAQGIVADQQAAVREAHMCAAMYTAMRMYEA